MHNSTNPLPQRVVNKRGVACFLHLFATTLTLLLFLRAPQAQEINPEWIKLLQSPIRLDRDVAQDSTRKPLELLALSQVKPGWSVMDIYSGGGYTAQLMALAVSSSGRVYAQMDKSSKTFNERLALHPQSNISFLLRPMDDLVPPDIPKLDLVTLIYSYHDIAYMDVNRLKMDKQIYDSLKEGGLFVIIDHAAQEGTGLRDTKSLHRIDKKLVIQDFLSVGFKLDLESDFLRNPTDSKDQTSAIVTPQADGFALRFKK